MMICQKEVKARGSKAYLPKKGSAAYALLISLHRAAADGTEFMRKQELIDAAEASGLSQVSIAPEKRTGKPRQFGGPPKNLYSRWSSMKTLIDNNLVSKTRCPAKYMLSDKGRDLALDCLSRSGILDSTPDAGGREETSESDKPDIEIMEFVAVGSPESSYMNKKKRMKDDIPVEYLDRDYHLKEASQSFCNTSQDVLRIPPLEDLQNLEDEYKVVLIVDDREGFVRRKPTSTKELIKEICQRFKIEVEVKRLPVGDAIWIARHKQLSNDYVLDFIVERKDVEDLHHSIRNNRYKTQKLRLQRTGIKKIMYVVEGDPNTCNGADSIKTAMRILLLRRSC
ncbi:hypothetical protein SOVF_185050 isoform A [Spinacia oleracea]|uniref:Crossover junction endonuclease MUS81 n=1 Tax=Spinacia oleracea TaxID=3562 RepID=A0A9R0HWC0_SPIOL|nr:crossover junction endonuclease MUS81-like isoform X1 [Spinacia oleracea]XP_056685224.1 crossover junction endonuclease MUS81-like isoform X1 [Spinacia oleracea]XP_056685238.1 crossover junction endonuclease MUS81-like isoform X1 [Spinacia oleracea]KNA06008.1 hypothetical protein SOVF_185050 isoform A [Spinacia oleracea]